MVYGAGIDCYNGSAAPGSGPGVARGPGACWRENDQFWFERLPVSESAAIERSTVLVVEDDLVVASAMKMLFERRGWHVLHAPDLTRAKALLSPPPQWVVLDLILPDGDGTELLREMQRRGLACKTVVTTGVAEPTHLKAVEEYQPTAILRKPTSFSRILEIMGVAVS